MSARAAVIKLNIKVYTAQDGAQNDQVDPQEFIERGNESDGVIGRPSIFNYNHIEYLENLIDEVPDIVIKDIMVSLTKEFEGLKISKGGLHNFMTDKCSVTLKRAQFHFIKRNSPEKIRNI